MNEIATTALEQIAATTARAYRAGWSTTMRIVRHPTTPYIILQVSRDGKVPCGGLAYKSDAASDFGPFINLRLTYSPSWRATLPPGMFVCPSNLKSDVQYPLPPPHSTKSAAEIYETAVDRLLEGHFVQLSAKIKLMPLQMWVTGYHILNLGGPGTLELIFNPDGTTDMNIEVRNKVIISTMDRSASINRIDDYIEHARHLMLPNQKPPTIPLTDERFVATCGDIVRWIPSLGSVEADGLYGTTDGIIMLRDAPPNAKAVFAIKAGLYTGHRTEIATDGERYWHVVKCGDMLVVVNPPPNLVLNPDDITAIKTLIRKVWSGETAETVR